MTKPPTTHRTPTGDVPGGPTGNGAPHSAQADPTPAASPVASAEADPRDGDRAGAGRPTRRDGNGRFIAQGRALTRIPPMSAGLAQALLDAQAEIHRVDTATRTQAILVAAVRFGDLVRHGGGEAS